MKEYIVLRREVNIVAVKVKAEDRDDAVSRVSKDYEGDEISTEYSHTLDTDTWSVEEDGTTYYHNASTGKFDKTVGGGPRLLTVGTRVKYTLHPGLERDNDYWKYNGQEATIHRVVTEADDKYDQEVLPMYELKFSDGNIVSAYLNEAIPSTQKED